MRRTLWVGVMCSVAMLTGGCGSSDHERGARRSDALARLQAANKARETRNQARAERLARDLAAIRARKRQDAEDEAGSRSAAGSALLPSVVKELIPFPEKRKEEMAAYAKRHYGIDDYRLRDPRVIVEHYTVSADARSAINTFAADVPDVELHELPGVCSHFVIDRDGTVYQLVDLGLMCRHTVGLNYTSIGIEHAGFSDGEILANDKEMAASLRLTNALRCRYGIDLENVIGHNESLSSPYHRENVAALRTQTHGDWTKADMDIYRGRLKALKC